MLNDDVRVTMDGIQTQDERQPQELAPFVLLLTRRLCSWGDSSDAIQRF